ncbi:MAG: hypothetical protein ABL958_02140 [Bdellovibrionia bacterium]
MSLRLRLILGASLILIIAEGLVLRALQDQIRPRYKEVIEDSLVEISQTMAAVLSSQPANGEIDTSLAEKTFKRLREAPLHANISGVEKVTSDFEMYITDEKGSVLFHSEDPSLVGRDFSKWNDVFLTLQGKYGTRSTRTDPEDKLSSIMRVGAPIRFGAELKGVVSAGRAEIAAESFLTRTLHNSMWYASLIFIMVFVAIVLLSAWLTQPIQKLTEYARKNRGLERIPLPRMKIPEFRDLGNAFEEMRITIEGKKTIENYVQALTHELKSPLTAIRGAAELGLEDMPEAALAFSPTSSQRRIAFSRSSTTYSKSPRSKAAAD